MGLNEIMMERTVDMKNMLVTEPNTSLCSRISLSYYTSSEKVGLRSLWP